MARKRKTNEQFLKELGNRPITPLDKYETALKNIRFGCDIDGHIWDARPDNVLHGTGCPVCGNKSAGLKFRKTNEILKDNGEWLLIDISTPKYPIATMAIDSGIWREYNGRKVFAFKSTTSRYISASYNTNNGSKYFHHIVLPKKDGFEVDHIKHGSLEFIDNRSSNLRYVTKSQNAMNRSVQLSNKSGVVGVYWCDRDKMWCASIMMNGKTTYLGSFINKQDAIASRKLAEREYFGEYAYSENN